MHRVEASALGHSPVQFEEKLLHLLFADWVNSVAATYGIAAMQNTPLSVHVSVASETVFDSESTSLLTAAQLAP